MVIGIIAILAAMLMPALAKAKQKGRQMNETSAGRQLMLAWTMYANDNSDSVLPGYIFPNGPPAYDDRNQLIDPTLPDGARYPWRLASYLANNFRSIYVNEGRESLEKAEQLSHGDYVYQASLYPSLGYNTVFLGGDTGYELTIQKATAYGYETDWLVTRVSTNQTPFRFAGFYFGMVTKFAEDVLRIFQSMATVFCRAQMGRKFQSLGSVAIRLCASALE